MSTFVLKGKNVIITGASSGIGKELSECFAREGSNLLLRCHPSETDIIENWATVLAKRYTVKTITLPIDLTEDTAPELFYQRIKEKVDKIDVLVNNAGIMLYGNFYEIPLDKQEMLVNINAIAYLKLMRLFLADMVEAGDGRIMNVVSVAAFQPTVHHATYGATKAFIQSLSEAVNQEIKHTAVKVFTLNPSYTDTPLLKSGGFPEKIRWFLFSGLSDPKIIAAKGMKAFKKEKSIYIVGRRNWIIHSILIRFAPRNLVNYISYIMLR